MNKPNVTITSEVTKLIDGKEAGDIIFRYFFRWQAHNEKGAILLRVQLYNPSGEPIGKPHGARIKPNAQALAGFVYFDSPDRATGFGYYTASLTGKKSVELLDTINNAKEQNLLGL